MAHEGEHKPNDFTAGNAALDLVNHVFTITDNTNKFPEYKQTEKQTSDGKTIITLVMRDDSLVNRVRDQSYNICIKAFKANGIDLRKEPERKSERLRLQSEAIELCDEHLATIQICRKHFHLSFKKIKYWGDLTRKAKNLLIAWHDSDKVRFKNI